MGGKECVLMGPHNAKVLSAGSFRAALSEVEIISHPPMMSARLFRLVAPPASGSDTARGGHRVFSCNVAGSSKVQTELLCSSQCAKHTRRYS
jgi:hypothetical protein